MYIKVENIREAEIVQDSLFTLGYKWQSQSNVVKQSYSTIINALFKKGNTHVYIIISAIDRLITFTDDNRDAITTISAKEFLDSVSPNERERLDFLSFTPSNNTGIYW